METITRKPLTVAPLESFNYFQRLSSNRARDFYRDSVRRYRDKYKFRVNANVTLTGFKRVFKKSRI